MEFHAKVEKEHYTVKTTGFAIAPFARYSFYENKIVRLFVDMGMGFSTVKVKDGDSTNGFEIGLKPGIEIKLNNKFSLVSKLGFAGYRDDYYKGENGFGYDPIFFLPEYGCTSAELSMEEKNKISHRGKALQMIKEELR